MLGNLFNQFVIAFREGIEASLIIMTVLMALKKRKAVRLQKAAYIGIGAAIIACSVGGYILGSIALVNNHGVELALYTAACITVLTMVFWMMKEGKNMRHGINQKIDSYHERTGWLPVLGMFAFVFFMISREGFEMTLLLLAFGAGIGGTYYVLAMIAGLACAVGISYALSRGILKINLGLFLQSTAYVLILFVVQLVFDVLHEGFEGGFFPEPSNQGLVNFIDFAHDQVPIFSYLGLALFMGLVVYFFTKSIAERRQKLYSLHA